MSGPALTPLASIAPVAPSKGPDAPAAEGSAPQAGETGFASELKRQMKGEKSDSADKDPSRKDEASPSPEATPAGSEQAPATAQPTPVIPPEMAALIAGMQVTPGDQPATEKNALDTDVEPDTALNPLLAQASLLNGTPSNAPKAASPLTGTDGNPGTMAAPGDTTAAITAAGGQKSGRGLLEPADPTTPIAELAARTSEPAAAAAPPTNSFAAMHAAALANLQAAAPQDTSSPVPLHVATPASSPHWPEEVGNKVSWMVNNTESHAELTLTPPQLGKVEVSITVSGDQTSAQFVAASPAARDLIEQNLPRLREILEQSGINLGQTDVGTSGQSAQSGDTPAGRQGGGWQSRTGGDEGVTTGSVPAQWARRGEGLVDTFA